MQASAHISAASQLAKQVIMGAGSVRAMDHIMTFLDARGKALRR